MQVGQSDRRRQNLQKDIKTKMHYFLLKCFTQTRNMSARMGTAYMRKTAFQAS